MRPSSDKSRALVAFAIGAHPDDIEFRIAGTLLLLKQTGFETHYLNIANGCCGSVQYDRKTAAKIRAAEGRQAAKILGAHFHPSLTNDLEISYDLGLLRKLSAIIRAVKPAIVLTHPPSDYMEDHTNTCRLVVTAAFTHGMPNFKSTPSAAVYPEDVTIYHCMPHGMRDGLRRRAIPGAFVNTTSVHETKLAALAAHQSQQNWLDTSQGLNSYLRAGDEMSLDVGRVSRKFRHAEGWWRHLHLGFSAKDCDPLAEALGKHYFINKSFEQDCQET